MPVAGTSQNYNPLLAFGAGATGGAGAHPAAMMLKQAKSRANWGLGLGVGILALSAVSSSDLNADQTNAQNVINSTTALTFTSAGTTGAEVAALRGQVLQLAGVVQKMAYDANLFSFNGAPTPPNTVQPAAVGGVMPAITQTASATTSNNNLIILAAAIIAVVLIVMMD